MLATLVLLARVGSDPRAAQEASATRHEMSTSTTSTTPASTKSAKRTGSPLRTSTASTSSARREQNHRLSEIGTRVRVWWAGDDAWFSGTVISLAGKRGHHIRYDDGEMKYHDLSHPTEVWELEGASNRVATEGSVADASATQELHAAVERNDPTELATLLGKGAASDGGLLTAARLGHSECLQLLLCAHATVDQADS